MYGGSVNIAQRVLLSKNRCILLGGHSKLSREKNNSTREAVDYI